MGAMRKERRDGHRQACVRVRGALGGGLCHWHACLHCWHRRCVGGGWRHHGITSLSRVACLSSSVVVIVIVVGVLGLSLKVPLEVVGVVSTPGGGWHHRSARRASGFVRALGGIAASCHGHICYTVM